MESAFILLVLLLGALGVLLTVGIIVRLQYFRRSLRQINTEIRRSIGGEREYWKRCRRKLWMSLFFFQ